MEQTISIKQLFELLRKRIGLIILGGLAGLLISALSQIVLFSLNH